MEKASPKRDRKAIKTREAEGKSSASLIVRTAVSKNYRKAYWRGKTYLIECTSKKVSALRLRVLPGGIARLSIPYGADEESIEAFVRAKSGWIAQAVEKAWKWSNMRGIISTENGTPSYVKLFGSWIPVTEDSCREVTKLEAGRLSIGTLGNKVAAPITEKLKDWMRDFALTSFDKALKECSCVLQGMAIRDAKLQVKSMRTRWGSCNPAKRRITLSLSLIHEDQRFIKYVVLHELAHFVHPNHGPGFIGFMDGHMPDWRAVRKLPHCGDNEPPMLQNSKDNM